MERLSTLMILLLAIGAEVLGCGVMPQGQAMTRNFTVSGFKLPTAMVFTSSTSAPAQLPGGIATTSDGAKSFVSRLVMQTVTHVLEQEGRNAGLPEALISMILSQLTVQVTYDPLECKTVTVDPTGMFPADASKTPRPHCIVVSNTVTALCTAKELAHKCELGKDMNIGAIDAKYLSISGSLTTTNIIMANWSKDMWQSILNRAVRMLASGPFASHYFSAFATVG